MTIFRILLIPFVSIPLVLIALKLPLGVFSEKFLGLLAATFFIIAGITDFLDGYIARKRKLVTAFGNFLDPVADKFLVVTSLILLQNLGRVHALVVVILILRELFITSLRLLASEKKLSIPVGQLGKWKTVTQMTAIPCLMISYDLVDIPMALIGTVLIYLASFLSLYSGLRYGLDLIEKIKLKRQQQKAKK